MNPNKGAGQHLFVVFQPVCVQLAKEHTRENVGRLMGALEGVDSEGLQQLQEYVLFPLRIVLKQPKKLSEELYTAVCDCMGQILTRTTVHRWEVCQDVFSTLSVLISSPLNYGTASGVSEEMKSAIVRCLDNLLTSTHPSALDKLYEVESMPMLGHMISVLLSLAQTERARHLRLEALHCLLSLMRMHSNLGLSKMRSMGDLFASFLPGLSMGLCKVITGDIKQGQMITVKGIEAWKQVVVLVMGDNSLDLENQQAQTEQKKKAQGTTRGKLAELRVKRDSDWVTSTSSNLLILVKDIVRVHDHSSWKVRSALADWAVQLLVNCTRSLRDSVPVLLEVLVGLLRDQYGAVASKAREGLESLSNHHMQGDSGQPLVEILEDNLYSLATSLPRQIRTADDSQKLSVLNLLSGYVHLLGPHTCSLLHSLPHLKRLSKALVQLLEFDCTDFRITDAISPLTGSAAFPGHISSTLQRPRKYFSHFSDDKITQELVHICRLLGFYGDADILVDHFLDIFHETKMYRLPATFILNEILVGTITTDAQYHHNVEHKVQSMLEPIVRMLTEEYLSPNNFNLKTCNIEDEAQVTSVMPRTQDHHLDLTSTGKQPKASLNSNILQICLFLEGFGKFSQVLGKGFSPLLITVLYPLMEKLGDENGFISTTAYLALQDICTHCGYSSVGDLLQSNSDYLVNSISVKLRYLHQNSRVPLVLKATLQLGSAELLPLLQDSIQEILSSLDQSYGEKATMFMKVLHSLVLAVEKWYSPAKDKALKGLSTQEITTAEELVTFFKEFHKNQLLCEADCIEADSEDVYPVGEGQMDPVGEGQTEDEDEIEDPPQHVRAVQEVLLRSKHLLSSHKPCLRLLVLDTISHATAVLTDYQNVLLPLIHQLWPPFVDRFSDEEKLVTLKAFQTLTCMAGVCGEFIMKRTVRDVFPKLTRFLKTQAHTSLKVGPVYKFTAEYRLQLWILSDLGRLSSLMGVEDVDIESLAKSCLPYLSARQPIPLQQACVLSLEQFVSIDPDSIWLMLNQIYCPGEFQPPSPAFPLIKFADSIGRRNEYTDNVVLLLTKLS